MRVSLIIRRIVGCCHVSSSYTTVLRHVIDQMTDKRNSWNRLSREQKRDVIAQVVYTHKSNRDLFTTFRF